MAISYCLSEKRMTFGSDHYVAKPLYLSLRYDTRTEQRSLGVALLF